MTWSPDLSHKTDPDVLKLSTIPPARLIAQLEYSTCKPCRGLGERHDAEPGDMYFRIWTCETCSGTGWDVEELNKRIKNIGK